MDKKILIVDDEPGSIFLLSELLEGDGYLVFSCNKGNEALEIFKSEGINIAFIDLNLPDMSGFEVCRRIREYKKDSFVWTCAITGYSSLLNSAEYAETNFDEHFFKPFDIALILETTEEAFKKLALFKQKLSI